MNNNLPESEKYKILVVDDHQLILSATVNLLTENYANAEIFKAQTAQETLQYLENHPVDLLVMDLSIPETSGTIAQTEIGIHHLQRLLKRYPYLNFMVQSSYVKALVRIKHEIDEHQGGFVIADKSLSQAEMLKRVNLALQGATHTKDIKTALELKPEWLEVLQLAFEDGLTDKAISEKMYKSERAVRTYWTKIQDVLSVYPEEGKNMRIQTEIRAREAGLID